MRNSVLPRLVCTASSQHSNGTAVLGGRAHSAEGRLRATARATALSTSDGRILARGQAEEARSAAAVAKEKAEADAANSTAKTTAAKVTADGVTAGPWATAGLLPRRVCAWTERAESESTSSQVEERPCLPPAPRSIRRSCGVGTD